MAEQVISSAPCPTCGVESALTGVGSASGRRYYLCSVCGGWNSASAAAAELGRLGGLARANGMSEERRARFADEAAEVRLEKDRKVRRLVRLRQRKKAEY